MCFSFSITHGPTIKTKGDSLDILKLFKINFYHIYYLQALINETNNGCGS